MSGEQDTVQTLDTASERQREILAGIYGFIMECGERNAESSAERGDTESREEHKQAGEGSIES